MSKSEDPEHPESRLYLLSLPVVLLLCFAGMLVLKYTQDILVDVTSFEICADKLVAKVHYKNRLSRPVSFSYDLEYVCPRLVRRTSGGSISVGTLLHVSKVTLEPNEEKEAIVESPFPSRKIIIDVIVRGAYIYDPQ